MKAGDLVRPTNSCGGKPGGTRCETAIILNSYLSHCEDVQVDSQRYVSVDVYEFELVCSCGIFQELDYEGRLELINESR